MKWMFGLLAVALVASVAPAQSQPPVQGYALMCLEDGANHAAGAYGEWSAGQGVRQDFYSLTNDLTSLTVTIPPCVMTAADQARYYTLVDAAYALIGQGDNTTYAGDQLYGTGSQYMAMAQVAYDSATESPSQEYADCIADCNTACFLFDNFDLNKYIYSATPRDNAKAKYVEAKGQYTLAKSILQQAYDLLYTYDGWWNW